MKPVFFLFTVWLALTSCRKDDPRFINDCTSDCITFKGRLVEQQTGLGLSNVNINFFFDKFSSGLGGNGQRILLRDIRTGLDGAYEFSIPDSYREMRGAFEFVGSIPGYVNASVNSEPYLRRISTNGMTDSLIEEELQVWESVPLTVRIKAVNNVAFDGFYFNHRFDNAININYSIQKNRMPFDESFTMQTASGIPTLIVWRTGNTFGNTGSIFLQGIDTIVVAPGSSGSLVIEL